MYIIHNDELVIVSLFTLFLSLVRFLSIPVNSTCTRKTIFHFITSPIFTFRTHSWSSI